MEPLLNVEQAAKTLNLSKDCIYDLVQTGKLPHIRISAKGKNRYILRFRTKDLERYIQENLYGAEE